MTDPYLDLLARKERYAPAVGFPADVSEPWLYPFQQHAVRWALAGGRRALFEDTGLGKSRQQLAWADRVADYTGGRVLILAPLAVGPQTAREADAVGIRGVVFARHPDAAGDARIVISNYDNLDKWDAMGEAAVVLDESGVLKNFTGSTQLALRDRFAATPYRLCATATPAPNDFTEFGTHAEFLGEGTRVEMLARFFVNDLSDTKKWRLKGHAVRPFWDWVASWALCARLPSDVGDYDDTAYNLPPLNVQRHVVNVDLTEDRDDGMLFRVAGLSATTLHQEKRRTAAARAAHVASIVHAEPDEPWLIWCETDYEATALRAVLGPVTEVSGSMTPEMKADRLLGFADAGGWLLTKPRLAGFGMNFQRCARMVFAGGSYSYEQFYQAIRRCYRFGQTRPVDVHVVMAYTEQHLWDVVSGKAADHDEMKAQMFAASRRMQVEHRAFHTYHPACRGTLPSWLITSETSPCSA